MTFGRIQKRNLPPTCTGDLVTTSRSQSLTTPRMWGYLASRKQMAKENRERENGKQALETIFHLNKFTSHRLSYQNLR